MYHCWVQVPATHAKELEEGRACMIRSGYKYNDAKTGGDMVEYHVDACKKLKQWVNTGYGSNLSIQFPTGQKSIIVFSYDECIFKQFTVSSKSWIGPNGETNVIQKDYASEL